jgi:hypothetical protein
MFAPIAPKGLSSTSRAPSLIRRSRGGTELYSCRRTAERGCGKIQTSPRKKKGTSSAVPLSR